MTTTGTPPGTTAIASEPVPGSSTSTGYSIRVTKRLPRVLAGVVLVLLAIHLSLNFYSVRVHELSYEFVGFFNVDEEQSAPTWYSSFALFVASMLLFAIWRRRKQEGSHDAPRWLILACGFAVLSFDEVASVHEVWNTYSEMDWTTPGAIVAGATALYFLGFLRRLPSRTRWLFLLGGAVFLGGAIGVERLTVEFWHRIRESPLAYPLIDAAEEGMEMMGVVIFIYALIDYMGASAARTSGPREPAAPIEIGIETD